MNFKSKTVIIVSLIVVAVIIIVAAGFWYWSQKKVGVSETSEEIPAEASAATEVKDGLGAEVFNKTNNPLSEELPETNPFRVKTNPFK